MTGFLRFFRRFPQINVGGDSTHFPPLEDAPVSLASLVRKRVGCDTNPDQALSADSSCWTKFNHDRIKTNIQQLGYRTPIPRENMTN